MLFGEHLILKLYRRVEMGTNPDVEIAAYLTEHGFAHTAALAGAIEYRRPGEPPWTLAALQAFVPNQGDAWRHMLARMDEFLTQHAAPAGRTGRKQANRETACSGRATADSAARLAVARPVAERRGTAGHADGGNASGLVQRDRPSRFCSRTVFESSINRAGVTTPRALTAETFALLRKQLPRLNADGCEPCGSRAGAGAGSRRSNCAKLRPNRFTPPRFAATATITWARCSWRATTSSSSTSRENPAARSASDGRKLLALRDVAGMIRSFHYAACAGAASAIAESPADSDRIHRLAQDWYFWMSAGFLGAYLRAAEGGAFLAERRRMNSIGCWTPACWKRPFMSCATN